MNVTVLGLGAMGTALAHAFLAAGHPTTVWNRTPARAEALRDAGAAVAPDVESALRASPLVVVCVLDAPAVRSLLAPAAAHLRGRVVVDTTSMTPDAARETAAWVGDRHATYVEAAIMVPTPVIGTPDALVLYSGQRDVVETHRPTLAALGGTLEHVGEEAGLAAVLDLGMLGVFFTGMTSFLHAAALLEADGVSARQFRPYAERIIAILPAVYAQLAGDVDRRRYPGDQDNLVMNEAALGHIVEASAARGIDASVIEATRTLARRSIERGHGEDSFSRVVDEIRTR